MKPTITIDSTNDIANITVQVQPGGAIIHAHQLKLGETAKLTMDQVDALARRKAKEALQAAIAQL